MHSKKIVTLVNLIHTLIELNIQRENGDIRYVHEIEHAITEAKHELLVQFEDIFNIRDKKD
jgi:hypothetical protein